MNLYVDAARPDDTGDGLSWATAKKTFAGIVAILGNGDVINVAAGTYTDAAGYIAWTAQNVTVLGPNAGVNPVTNLAGRVAEANINLELYLNNVSVTVDGLSFTCQPIPTFPHGACLRIAPLTLPTGVPITPVVRNCIFTGNVGASSIVLITGVTGVGQPRLVNPVFEYNLVYNFTSSANSVEVRLGDGGMFRGNQITSDLANNTIGPQLYGSTNLRILDNVFENFKRSCLNLNGASGYREENVLVEGNTFRNCAEQGIRLRVIDAPISDITIRDNLFEDNDFDINIWSTPAVPSAILKVSGLVIENNTFRRNTDRVLKPAVLPTAWPAWPQYANINLLLLQPGATGTVTIQNNTFEAYGSYVPGQREYFGILVAGFSLTTLTIQGNSITGLTESAIVVPDSAGVIVMTNYSLTNYPLQSGAIDIDQINLNGNKYARFDNGIACYDKVGAVYGVVPVGVSIVASGEQFSNVLTYGVKSGAGEIVDARNNWWGDDSGPSGGVLDPVTSLPANGTGCLVSTYVRFDPAWQLNNKPLTAPEYRTEASGPNPGKGSSSDSQGEFERPYNEDGIFVFRDGHTRIVSKGAPGSAAQTHDGTGIVKNWSDKPYQFSDKIGKP